MAQPAPVRFTARYRTYVSCGSSPFFLSRSSSRLERTVAELRVGGNLLPPEGPVTDSAHEERTGERVSEVVLASTDRGACPGQSALQI